MRNLAAGYTHATIASGVVYRKDGSTVLKTNTTYVVAELEPSTGKTYL